MRAYIHCMWRTCLCARVCARAQILCVCVPVCVRTHAQIQCVCVPIAYACEHTYMRAHIHCMWLTCLCIRACVCVCVCMCVRVLKSSACVCPCVCVRMHTNIARNVRKWTYAFTHSSAWACVHMYEYVKIGIACVCAYSRVRQAWTYASNYQVCVRIAYARVYVYMHPHKCCVVCVCAHACSYPVRLFAHGACAPVCVYACT